MDDRKEMSPSTAVSSAQNEPRTWDSAIALDAESLAVFADKGRNAPGVLSVNRELNGNSIKIRRVLQLTRDLTGKPADQIRILDLGCGDGVYTIEAGSKGAQVLGVDGRDVRMQHGVACAERNGFGNVRFSQEDVRALRKAQHGEFDAIWCLGILYHLDVPDIFHWMENLYEMCVPGGFMVVDTHIAPRTIDESEYKGRKYEGMRTREHEDTRTPEQRRNETFRSLDNTYNFLFSRNALVRLLNDTGFTSVMEVHAPLEVGKRSDRVTMVATKGSKVRLSTYPVINGKTEAEIAEALKPKDRPVQVATEPTRRKPLFKRGVGWALRKVGYELRRI